MTRINLEARIMKLEEQTQWMFHKMGELMGFGETTLEEAGPPWRREIEGGE